MTAEQKLLASLQMSKAVRELAIAGVRSRFPDAESHEQLLRLAVVMLGPELAAAAYPEIAALDPA